jgi:hypothetical protein
MAGPNKQGGRYVFFFWRNANLQQLGAPVCQLQWVCIHFLELLWFFSKFQDFLKKFRNLIQIIENELKPLFFWTAAGLQYGGKTI